MIINKANADRRLTNPMNLMNRGDSKRFSAMSLFVRPAVDIKPIVDNRISEVVPPANLPDEIDKTSIPSSLSLQLKKVTSVPESLNQSPLPVVVESEPGHNYDGKLEQNQSPVDSLLDDADSKIKLASAHNKAISVIGQALNKLESKLNDDVVPVKMLPSIISGLGKVVTDIRREQADRNKNDKDEVTHIHFYCPNPKPIEQFEVIEVS